jgi:hypothetical protein
LHFFELRINRSQQCELRLAPVEVLMWTVNPEIIMFLFFNAPATTGTKGGE